MTNIKTMQGENRYLIFKQLRMDITCILNFLESDDGEWENKREGSIVENQIEPLLQVVLDIIDEEICEK